ncbi:bifunctional metallophosphatase/5'-nucleotidase [Hyalangium rubrum]|uniref:Bifunctional UDP-sugar hydrolase/5'-nucleotidase n=1 Tax=Hyalangium rubrum TaxID=3103134 RepID=A0ABU5HBI0_9BACT|nr:bifunctional UDP-sugar hydrolase/5'-nucleotidase [Hyalangium sp. s54d21]MDY7230482.1 bifunctional UDP-sugar hydrolase/5'-nucleotidase [Hyalangium sp. s54d21]
MLRLPLSLAVMALGASACRSAPQTSEPVAATAAPAAPAAPPEPLRLTVVGTNDLHGWIAPHRTSLQGGVEIREGGAATFAGYVARLREDNPGRVLLLDGGDLFQGTLASNLSEGAVVVDVYNHLGYAAAAIGNHEFDYGPVGPSPVPTKPGDDPLGALKARLQQARFPILSANIREAEGGQRPAWLGNDGTHLVTLDGVKVGIIGLTTPSTPHTTNPTNVASLRFEPLASAVPEAARSLRERGAEVILGVAHAGGRCPRLENPRDTSSCDWKDGEIYGALEELPPGTLDAVVAGHTHQVMGHFIHGVPVIETSGLGRSFGYIELFVDPVSRKVLQERTAIHAAVPLCVQVDAASGSCDGRKLRDQAEVKLVPATFLGKPVEPDATVSALIAPALERVEQEQRRELGVQIPVPLKRNYEAESVLGDFLADSFREAVGADVALLNPGGLRADIDAGPLTFGDVYEVLPFDNTVAFVTMSGDELKRLLQLVYGQKKGVFQVSGLKVTLARCPGPERFQGATLPNGRKLEPGKLYRVVMPDFLARGGDGLGPALDPLPPGRIDLGLTRPGTLRDELVAYWQARKKPITVPTLGRIAYVDRGGECPATPAR